MTRPLDAASLREAVLALPTHTRRNGCASPTLWVTRRDVLQVIDRAALAQPVPVASADAAWDALRHDLEAAIRGEGLDVDRLVAALTGLVFMDSESNRRIATKIAEAY